MVSACHSVLETLTDEGACRCPLRWLAPFGWKRRSLWVSPVCFWDRSKTMELISVIHFRASHNSLFPARRHTRSCREEHFDRRFLDLTPGRWRLSGWGTLHLLPSLCSLKPQRWVRVQNRDPVKPASVLRWRSLWTNSWQDRFEREDEEKL